MAQEAIDVLTRIFDWVGFRTNVRKMVGMTCQKCRTAGRNFEG